MGKRETGDGRVIEGERERQVADRARKNQLLERKKQLTHPKGVLSPLLMPVVIMRLPSWKSGSLRYEESKKSNVK